MKRMIDIYEPISAPFVELNFYYAEKRQEEAFREILNAVLAVNAKIINQAIAVSVQNEDTLNFHNPSLLNSELIYFEPDNIDKLLSNKEKYIVSLYLANAIGIRPNSVELLKYAIISEDASLVDKHPIVLFSSGDMFLPAGLGNETEKHIAGSTVYKRFRYLVEKTNPSYGAITSEWSLECPTDLKKISTTLSFRNFFLNKSLLTDERIEEIKSLYSNAYVEEWENGIYISTYLYFNPSLIDYNPSIAEKDDASKKIIEIILDGNNTP